MNEYAGAHLLSYLDGLNGRRLRRPEFRIIPKFNRIRRQVREITVRKLRPGFKLSAQTLKFLQVVRAGNLQSSPGENTFQILLDCLLGMEAGGVVGAFTGSSPSSICKVAVSLSKPPTPWPKPTYLS
jgi:hypothetical protein